MQHVHGQFLEGITIYQLCAQVLHELLQQGAFQHCFVRVVVVCDSETHLATCRHSSIKCCLLLSTKFELDEVHCTGLALRRCPGARKCD